MNTIQELLTYIKSKEQNGALLLAGKWGCGKSYLIHSLTKEKEIENDYVIVVVSLFGIDSVDALNSTVKQKVIFAKKSVLLEDTGERAARIRKFLSGLFEKAENVIDVDKTIGTVFSVNPFDLIQIDGDMGKNKQLVLVFDDFERSNLEAIELLGAINEYVENKKIKSIIVADEEKINDDKYVEFKEKVVFRTLRIKPDFHAIISSIIEEYRETVSGYKDFLIENKPRIWDIFDESESENLRILKSLLMDFERVYEFVLREDFNKSILDGVLTSFGKILFKSRSKTESKNQEQTTKAPTFNLTQSMQEHLEAAAIGPIKAWIQEGVWDETAILDYFEDRYRQTEHTEEWKLLNLATWELDDEIFRNAFPKVLEMSYQGTLTCGQLIRFIQRISIFQKLGILDEYNIDYVKIEAGLNKRLKRIADGSVQEPRLNTFITQEELDAIEPAARDLYQKVYESGENTVDMLLHKRSFIVCIEGGTDAELRSLRYQAFVSFDVEMLDAIYHRYISSNVEEKRNIGLIIKDLSLKRTNPTEIDCMKDSVENLQTLSERIEAYRDSVGNVFSGIMDNSCIDVISHKISELKKWIDSLESARKQ